MRLKVSRARSGLHGSGVGSDGGVRTSSLGRSCEAQWAESLQERRERGEQEPRARRKAHISFTTVFDSARRMQPSLRELHMLACGGGRLHMIRRFLFPAPFRDGPDPLPLRLR